MKSKILLIVLSVLFFSVGFLFSSLYDKYFVKDKLSITNFNQKISKIISKPLEKYTINNLTNANIKPGQFILKEKLSDKEGFETYLFSFLFSPSLDEKTKTTTGIINLPKTKEKYPIVLMLRGYVDQKIYTSGTGTKRAGEYLAENNFITIAPDFLGYGDSDKESEDIFESRFQTYITAISLLNTINSLSFKKEINSWDEKNIFLWGHSNGGQIALTLLEITRENIPTTLWAPVSKPFPYSVLYYTDESEDKGKLIRSRLSDFEGIYDIEKYSMTNYFDQINKTTNIQIHQGTNDDAVPYSWSDTLHSILEKNDLNVSYFKYPGADHNLNPDWNLVINRDIQFFEANLKKESI